MYKCETFKTHSWGYDEYEITSNFMKDNFEEEGYSSPEEYEKTFDFGDYEVVYELFFGDFVNNFTQVIGKEIGFIFGYSTKEEFLADFHSWRELEEMELLTDLQSVVKEFAERANYNEFKLEIKFDEKTDTFSSKSVIYNGSFMTPDKVLTLTPNEFQDLLDKAREQE